MWCRLLLIMLVSVVTVSVLLISIISVSDVLRLRSKRGLLWWLSLVVMCSACLTLAVVVGSVVL